MVRRRSNPSCGLDRSKSTSSARSVQLEHIRPAQAELVAHAAAMLAFTRAGERSSAENTMWPPQRQSNTSHASRHSPGKSPTDETIHRRQSIRFVPPRPQADRAQTAPIERDSFPSQNSASVENDETDDSSGPLPNTDADPSIAITGDIANALMMSDEHYTPMDDIASVPSSYRRIRKSRSMFNTLEPSVRSGILGHGEVRPSTTTNQLPLPSPKHSTTVSVQKSPIHTRKTLKSTNRDRSRRGNSSPISNSRRETSSQAWAHDYEETLPGRSGYIRSQSSTLFRPKSPSVDRPFKKTMRNSEDESPASTKYRGDGSLRMKARKVSKNFKHKLKSLFSSRKSENGSPSIPCQPVQTRNKYSQLPDTPADDFGAMFRTETSLADKAAISRVTSGVPSLHAVPSHRQVRSRKGSVNSLESDGTASDEKSRVTSWSNSETESLMTVNSQRGEWIRQRLSVIKENGTHVPSSSSGYVKGISQEKSAMEDSTTHTTTLVDSQRIYSALMKRLEQSQQEEEKTAASFAGPVAVPRRTSSRTSRRDSSSGTGQNSIVSFSTCSSLGQGASGSCGSVRHQRHNALSSSASAPSSGDLNNERNARVHDGSGRNLRQPRSHSSMRTVSARNSAFFGSPACHLFRTKSPYRKAIQDAMKDDAENASQPKSPEYNPWMRSLNNLPIRRPSTSESDMDHKMQYAESIYSCDTDEPAHPSRNTVSLAESFPRPPSAHGDATIFVEPFVYKPTPAAASKHRETSSGSSIEWKSWLSAKVSKLEGSPSAKFQADGIAFTQSGRNRLSRHVRESAQITDGDDGEVFDSYQPATPVSSPAREQFTLPQESHKACSSLRSTPPSPLASPRAETTKVSLDYSTAQPEILLPCSPSLHSTRARTPSVVSSNSQREVLQNKPLASREPHSPASSTQQPPDTGSILTARLVRRRSRARPGSLPVHDPDQDLATVVEKQFGKTENFGDRPGRFTMPTGVVKSENVNPHIMENDSVSRPTTQDSTRGSHGTFSRKDNGQKVVDMFVNRRRRRTVSGENEGAFV